MIENYIVYVDLDGVLADFDAAVVDRFGKNMSDMSKGELWGRIKNYDEKVQPWFATLPKCPDADILWNFLQDNFAQVQILTASGSTPRDAGKQKKEWVWKNYGYPKVNVVGASHEKAFFADENTVLIDDRSRSIDPFIDRGGIGILHKNARDTIATLKSMMEDWE